MHVPIIIISKHSYCGCMIIIIVHTLYIHVCSLLCEKSKVASVLTFGIEGHTAVALHVCGIEAREALLCMTHS